MAARKERSRSRRIVVLALPGAFSLDALGPFEVFQAAARFVAVGTFTPRFDVSDIRRFDPRELGYHVELVGAEPGVIETASAVPLFASRSLADVREAVDTLIVSGGDVRSMMQAVTRRPEILKHLRRLAKRSRRVASVCTGSFLLAAAGLLDGKRATTHWAACENLQKLYPKLQVERDPIFTQDGNIYTSAGATTGIDLALALVADDHGRELSRHIARWLVLYVERPSGQSQHSIPLRTRAAERAPLRELQTWIVEHLRDDLSVSALAERVGMSPRNFARAFRRELRMTPAAFVEAARIEAARRKLELGRASIEHIAEQVGFGSVESLRRAFARQVGVSPSLYRSRLASVA